MRMLKEWAGPACGIIGLLWIASLAASIPFGVSPKYWMLPLLVVGILGFIGLCFYGIWKIVESNTQCNGQSHDWVRDSNGDFDCSRCKKHTIGIVD